MMEKKEALKQYLESGSVRQIRSIIRQLLNNSNNAMTMHEIHRELIFLGYNHTYEATRQAIYRMTKEKIIVAIVRPRKVKHFTVVN